MIDAHFSGKAGQSLRPVLAGINEKRKKRGGFCRPPRQLYPQEERGIQR